ncbi:alpha/beta hydrolase [Aureibacter tunicatorum]|uniref:Arylformamidase n=1 Tax=Aureibacter tunicatorum TaxID=866807 RepID=A0AAE3XRA9_9BACT|nr:alpha/beta hydrolase [Aureibacter tunicatorum]MDR6240004.1 arylformamidase [Aureibacter tunicatorum]BDD04476.1 esterase [Aureibacter tunicatorum]
MNIFTMTTPQHQLNLRLRHSDFQAYLDINEYESERVRKDYVCCLNEKYGEHLLQAMDVFPSPIENSPILIFIHGGYWRGLDKKSYSFVAEPFVRNNMTVCVVNYRLLPQVNMKSLLDDVMKAVAWIQKEAKHYNGDAHSLILSGHSAGGHIALKTYLMNEKLRPSIKAICSLSGIFDLNVVKNSYLNETLKLDAYDADSYSVSNKDLSILTCPTLLSVGSDETELFIEQSKTLFSKNKHIANLKYFECEHLNHYQIIHHFGHAESVLARFVIENK